MTALCASCEHRPRLSFGQFAAGLLTRGQPWRTRALCAILCLQPDWRVYMDPTALARESFESICADAYANRPDAGGTSVIIDGTAYSPSTRACPGFEDELDQLTNAYAHGGYHLFWEDGCLLLAAPDYMPED